MAQRQQKTSQSTPPLPPQLAAVTLHAAGIDIGAEGHFVALPPSDDPQPVRGFGAYPGDVEALADWLTTCGITTLAMASTGVSWLPLFARLETRGCAVLLVEPQQVQQSKGRPTSDVHDGQWSHRLHPFGLRAGAFRPDDQGCVRRSDLRQRARLLTSAAQHIQHRPKALTPMNRKLQPVVSALTGVTGLAILRALLAGARDPATLAQLRDDRGTHDEATIARALQGTWRDEPLCALAQAVALSDV
jgi:transposase